MKSCFSFQKRLDFFSFLWYCVVLTGMEVQPMKNVIQELWNGNIMPQDDCRNNSKEMKVSSKVCCYPKIGQYP